MLNNCTNLGVVEELSKNKSMVAYVGFDLTGAGLHVGHISTLIPIVNVLQSGNKAIVVLGGGTTYIGDPSGKEEMRKMLTKEIILQNTLTICKDILTVLSIALPQNNQQQRDQWVTQQIKSFNPNNEVVLTAMDEKLLIVNNFFWLSRLNYLDFLRDVAISFSVNKLIKMDTFEKRLINHQPLSLMEMNYPPLQAYDFYHLCKTYGCNVQIGGSDQWGNIIAGIDFIGHKFPNSKVAGITINLLETADGKKMGKTEGGTIWLNSHLCDNEIFRNYFFRLPNETIEILYQRFCINNAINLTSRQQSEELAMTMFNFANREFNKAMEILYAQPDETLIELLVRHGKISSKGEVVRLIEAGGIKVNDNAVQDKNFILQGSNTISIGKNRTYLVRPLE